MASQQDLQELLRLLTVGRKIPMMQAMTQIKALQAADLKSIKQIAEAPLDAVQSALKDDKAARPLQNACKAALKRASPSGGPTKRPAPDTPALQPKRTKTDVFMAGPVELTPQQLEKSLELPLCMDEERISETILETNRAPLVLAFAVELLRYTMPEQPLSSRLSLGQALVGANSRSKAVSIGLDKGLSADQEGWGEGQPRVKVMGRELPVLKRGGYEWKGDEEETTATEAGSSSVSSTMSSTMPSTQTFSPSPASTIPTWKASKPLTLKSSTFVAHSTTLVSPALLPALLTSLKQIHPNLHTATHNAWAYRLRPARNSIPGARPREACDDDGETGAGNLILRVMRDAGDTVDTLVVMSRWFGGTMLGPDRWRLMRRCVEDALGERLRVAGGVGGEAVWGLDLEGERKAAAGPAGAAGKGVGGGMRVHRPEGARGYLLRGFGRVVEGAGKSPPKRRTVKAEEAEREENLGLVLGALRMVFESWADTLDAAELDRRAWGWYVAVRPEVESGQAGWGEKGRVRLSDVLKLRRGVSK